VEDEEEDKAADEDDEEEDKAADEEGSQALCAASSKASFNVRNNGRRKYNENNNAPNDHTSCAWRAGVNNANRFA
jgi:hypothetical protein